MCVHHGLAPDSFWRMPPPEVWWFLTAKIPDLFTRPTEAGKWDRLSKLAENWKPKRAGTA